MGICQAEIIDCEGDSCLLLGWGLNPTLTEGTWGLLQQLLEMLIDSFRMGIVLSL